MKTKIQIKLDILKKIIYNAETNKKLDGSLSETLVFELESPNDNRLGSDYIRVTLKSNYKKCVGKEIW